MRIWGPKWGEVRRLASLNSANGPVVLARKVWVQWKCGLRYVAQLVAFDSSDQKLVGDETNSHVSLRYVMILTSVW